MPIPIEFFSVIIPKHVLNSKYPGGESQYKNDCPNGSFKEDDSLTRVGFMNDVDLHFYCEDLIKKGLEFDNLKNQSKDFVVVQSTIGKRWNVDWLEIDNKGNYAQLKT